MELSWPFLLVCLILGTIGGLAWIRARKYLGSRWKQLPRRWQIIVICSAVVLAVAGVLVSNRHRPDEQSADILDCLGLLFALLLWAAYRAFSRTLDAVHEKFLKR